MSDIRCVVALPPPREQTQNRVARRLEMRSCVPPQAGGAPGSACRNLCRVRYRALMSDRNRRFLLRERPSGRIGPDTFELTEEAVPEIGDGQALVRVDWISLDPTNRTWINDTPTYLPPVGIGEVMRAGGLGEVVASKNPNYVVGQTVQGLVGWQEYAVASDAMPLFPVDVAEGISPSAYMGALGMTGLTAWVGIRDIGKPQPGETVVVSAAAGAVGSVAGQLAKADGARVVGIAGGPEKCALLTDQLGFDAAVDHRADDWAAQLAAATPNGIDVDFENVGGAIMDAIFARVNVGARVALCGLISGYNSADPPPGPRAFANLLIQRATLQGFIVLDHFGRAPEAIREIAGLITEGRLTPLETVVEGFEQLPTAINMLFDGKNVGKLVVKTSG
jgi:NADPH-dependent curcumin reductase CurA